MSTTDTATPSTPATGTSTSRIGAHTASAVDAEIAARLQHARQRYTSGRRALVTFLLTVGRPVDMAEITAASPGLPTSSVYRNLVVLEQAGVVVRFSGTGAQARYELSEDLLGHHHHLICTTCGRMEDYEIPAEVEDALRAVSARAADRRRFEISSHRLELRGQCATCA